MIKKRILSICLVVIMVLSSNSFNVFAKEIANTTKVETSTVQQSNTSENLESSNDIYTAGYEMVIIDNLMVKFQKDGNILAEYDYQNEILLSKRDSNKTTYYTFDEDGKIDKISITYNSKVYELKYFYEIKENTKFLKGFSYNDDVYTFIRDDVNYIKGIVDVNNDLLVCYNYDEQKKLDIVNYVNESAVLLNPMCGEDFLYDDISKLYYINGRFFNPETERFIDGVGNDEMLTEKNPFINEKLRSWYDSELAAEEWKSALLQNSSYGKPIDYSSNWYSDLSTVELLARLIYGENCYKSTYASDQKAISRVVFNRTSDSEFGDKTLKGVATKKGHFATITGDEDDTYIARNPDTIKNKDQWQNATFLACLLCTTTDEYEWNQIAPMPTGIDTQLYFVGFNYAYKYNLFRSNNGELQYYMDGSWVNIYDVVVCGRGVLSSINELNDNSRNVNKNVFFNRAK